MKHVIQSIQINQDYFAWVENEIEYRQEYLRINDKLRFFPTAELAIKNAYKQLRRMGVRADDILV